MADDLFTIAAARTYVGGVSRQAVEQRIEKTKYTVKWLKGKRFVKRDWLDAWKAERTARGQQLITGSHPSQE